MASATSRALASGNWKMINPADPKPLQRQLRSSFLAPKTTRPMSRMRMTRPSGVARRMTSANCEGCFSRPKVVKGICVSCPRGVGCWPICPVATSAFCSRSAATTSPAVRFRAASLPGLTQIRML